MDQVRNDSQASSGASPPSSGGRNLPKFEVSVVNENDMKEESNNGGACGTDDTGLDSGGVIVIKSIEDADTSAVSPFIVSLPSEEGATLELLLAHTFSNYACCLSLSQIIAT